MDDKSRRQTQRSACLICCWRCVSWPNVVLGWTSPSCGFYPFLSLFQVFLSYLIWRRSCPESLPTSGLGVWWSDGSAQTFSSPGRLWTNDDTQPVINNNYNNQNLNLMPHFLWRWLTCRVSGLMRSKKALTVARTSSLHLQCKRSTCQWWATRLNIVLKKGLYQTKRQPKKLNVFLPNDGQMVGGNPCPGNSGCLQENKETKQFKR